jgi:hypothetical protein
MAVAVAVEGGYGKPPHRVVALYLLARRQTGVLVVMVGGTMLGAGGIGDIAVLTTAPVVMAMPLPAVLEILVVLGARAAQVARVLLLLD